ncbi:SRPBCC family protein [Streptomyces sp. OM5714]|uniref:SRPBCC family protein n=1 Tax=Streptomyces sp. OM5714 TaxID=2602736 RepID=UPI0013DCFEA4|nr:SRPBCC family protein [Streptomyces sp. OM5714]
MGNLTFHAVGAASADTAWERYAVIERWPSWSPQIKAVHADGEYLRPGLSGTIESVARIRIPFVVASVDPTRRTWSWRIRFGPARVRLHHEVRTRGHGCETSLTIRGPTLVLAAYAPLAKLAMHRLVRR